LKKYWETKNVFPCNETELFYSIIKEGREVTTMTDKKKVGAETCSYVDEENCELKIEITLPGVKREDIHLKMLDDIFTLVAERGEFDYVRTGSFHCPVKASDAVAHYENGLLEIAVPFKDRMDGALDIPID
jgi:HSP20 family molecular chaperone IbpA